ncbi:MAG: SanA protein, partial [Treponema sp.]|nr:SanA protein [Treponema sp.]
APRAVYLARKLGLDAVAYEAPEVLPYHPRTKNSWRLRESLARVKAFLDITFHTKPKYLGAQIPITGDAAASWD